MIDLCERCHGPLIDPDDPDPDDRMTGLCCECSEEAPVCIHCGEPADDDETEMCDDCYAERNPDPNFVI